MSNLFFKSAFETNFSYISLAEIFAFKSTIELELSITIGNGVFKVSSVLLLIIGFINKSSNPKIDIKRKNAKSKLVLA